MAICLETSIFENIHTVIGPVIGNITDNWYKNYISEKVGQQTPADV